MKTKNHQIISTQLISWYNKENIIFPWRKSSNSYTIWISEIMLQQTQVFVVEEYFNRWMKQYSTLRRLYSASLDDLSMLWEGLGYYSRVHNIYKTAQILSKQKQYKLPNNYNDLIDLPGIGDYTASAILSIAHKKKYPAIDGNLKRVFSRLHMLSIKKQNLKSIKTLAQPYFINQDSGNLNQAFMDLGRTICRPRNPKCDVCPIYDFCSAFINKKTSLYPKLKQKKTLPTYDVAVGMIMKKNKFLISKRLTTGMLPNLWELPGGKIMINESPETGLKREILEETGLKVQVNRYIGNIKHQYSHFKINIGLFICQVISGTPKPLKSQAVKWIEKKQIKDFAFPTATHKLFKLL
tara:strand:- start:30834 stop:31889 length:1056 start_codon:yes stop_codon:yes gene_type:complete